MWTTQISILLSVLHASAASSPLCEAQTSGCSVDDTNLLQKSDPGRNSVNKPLTEDTNALSLSQQHQTGEQSARALDDMNKRYENMLREVVAGGPKELPTDSMLDPIINQFTVFKAELVGQQAHHQSLVTAALGAVAACNTNKANAFAESGTGVTDLETAMSSARTSHSLCRASETTAGADAAASCKLFEDQQASTCQAAAAWVPSNLASVGLLATDCVAKQAALTQSSSTCDTDQAQFELDFCAWSSRLKIVCSELQACHGEALAERTLIVAEVEELESSHKRMHVAYEKALCFLNLLKTAKSANLTSTHIDSCTDLSPDTSALSVTYPNAPSAVTCSTVAVTHQPGDAEWRTTEYVNLAAAQLEPTVACPAAVAEQEYEWNADPSPIGQLAQGHNCKCTKPGAAANERTQFAYYYLIGATWNNGGKIADCDSNHLNNCCYNELGDTFTYEALDKACAAKCDTWDDCFGYYVGTEQQPAMRGVPGFQPNIDAVGTCYAAHAICTVYYTEGTWENRPASWTLAQRNGVAPGWMTYNHNGATPQYNGVGFWCQNVRGCERKEA